MANLVLLGLLLVAIWAEGTLAKDTMEERISRLEFKLARQQQSLDMMEREKSSSSLKKQVSGCPRRFDRTFGDSCYFFSDESVSWEVAKEECKDKANGAYLAEIDDSDENHYLRQETMTVRGSRWFGLEDPEVIDKWIWYESMNVIHPGDYDDWSKGEPNNIGREKCALFYEPQSYHWNNLDCSYKRSYICEVRKGRH